jgi:PTH1 family peptidyl-tRNA hydrolase
MIKLIVGLGNPGRQYEKTRHNAGFFFLDELAKERSLEWLKKNEFQAHVAEMRVASDKVLMMKPQTYMNRSGVSVGLAARYFKLNPDEILVVHDELDFDAGKLRVKKDGGHAGHNGLKDIINHLGSRSFYRIRLGVGRPVNESPVADYVLSEPSKQERQLLLAAINRGLCLIDRIIVGDMDLVMNELNN